MSLSIYLHKWISGQYDTSLLDDTHQTDTNTQIHKYTNMQKHTAPKDKYKSPTHIYSHKIDNFIIITDFCTVTQSDFVFKQKYITNSVD